MYLMNYLASHASDPDSHENVIFEYTLKAIYFVVDLAPIYFIKECHKYENIKYDCEMYARCFQFDVVVVFNDTVYLHPIFDLTDNLD